MSCLLVELKRRIAVTAVVQSNQNDRVTLERHREVVFLASHSYNPPPLPLSWGSREGTASHHSSFWLVVFHALSIKGCCLHAGCQEESSTCILKLSPQGTVCYTPPGEEEIVLLLAKQVMLVVFKTTATGNREHRWHSHSSEIVEISPILFS